MRLSTLILLLFSASLMAAPCGKEGSLEERIKDCNSTLGNFALVHRSEAGFEIHKDLKSGLIWSDRLSVEFNQYGSQKACGQDLPGLEALKDLKWRLPTIRELEVLAHHGMKESVGKMNYAFWSSTPVKFRSRRARRRNPVQAYLWDGIADKTDAGDLRDAASVRCVSR